MAHMVFSCTDDSLICGRIGAQDYAGGTAVHINAGVAALVLVLLLGKRVGWPKDQMRPHNLTLTMLGAGMLWLGWYGFNVGSIVFGTTFDEDPDAFLAQFISETGRTFANTTLATMAAMLGWLLIERLLHGKATSLGAASGIVAGLVAITPACGAVNIGGAVAIGAIAGGVCAWAVGLKYKLGLRRLARRGRRAPGRRHHRHRADRLLLHLRRCRRHRRPVLRRRLRLAGRPDPRCPGRHRLDRVSAPRSSAWPSSTRSGCGSTRRTRSTASTSPSTASRRTTCTAARSGGGTGILAASTAKHLETEGANA